MPSGNQPPLVSVVTATFNRSRALRCAIECVRGQTLGDWEHWVIGDACTDDTADVVASLGDSRVKFHNLPQNCGEQSGPNSEGLRRASGRYIAMLNHDDLWLPDHLELAVRALEKSGADLVFPLAMQVEASGEWVLHNWAPKLAYSPELFIPASSWVFRRELVDRLGPWRSVQTIRNIPSQDWLFRAWRAGASLKLLPLVTVVFLPSRGRKNCYVGNPAEEQEAWLQRIRSTPDLRAELTLEAAFRGKPSASVQPQRERVGFVERLRRARIHYTWKGRRGLAETLARWTRGHPTEWEVRLGGGSAANLVNWLRRERGLNALPKPPTKP
jgi:glycosyltransferase involved in cell wall biosynthesis